MCLHLMAMAELRQWHWSALMPSCGVYAPNSSSILSLFS